jgi:PhnB protein
MGNARVPEGFHTATPYLAVPDAKKQIDFMKQVFGAEEQLRMPNADGSVGHAELKIGDSVIMTGDAGELRPMLYLYVDDVDSVFKKALEAGAAAIRQPEDQFYGDRSAQVKDPLGNIWFLATAKEEVPQAEQMKRWEEISKQQQQTAS